MATILALATEAQMKREDFETLGGLQIKEGLQTKESLQTLGGLQIKEGLQAKDVVLTKKRVSGKKRVCR